MDDTLPPADDINTVNTERPGSAGTISGFSGATTGEALVKLAEAAGVEVPEEAKAQLIEEITDDDALQALLDADMGPNIKIKRLNAQRIFGSWLMRKMEIPPIIMSWWFSTIGSAQDACRFSEEFLRKEGLDEPTKLELIKHWINANEALGVLIEKAQGMAREVGALKPPRAPKNKPPNTLIQTNVVVQQSSGKSESSS